MKNNMRVGTEIEHGVEVEDCSILERSACARAVGNADLARNPALWAAKGDNYDKKRPDPLGSSSYHPGWEVDQRLKPDESLGYHYDGTFSGPVGVGTLHFPNDRFQIFAYCAEARTKALGTEPTGGVFTSFTNLQNFGYADAHLWHSGEFRSFYAARWQYWAQVLTTVGIQPITP